MLLKRVLSLQRKREIITLKRKTRIMRATINKKHNNVSINLDLNQTPRVWVSGYINDVEVKKLFMLIKANNGMYFTFRVRSIYRDGEDKNISNKFITEDGVEFISIKIGNLIRKCIINNY